MHSITLQSKQTAAQGPNKALQQKNMWLWMNDGVARLCVHNCVVKKVVINQFLLY